MKKRPSKAVALAIESLEPRVAPVAGLDISGSMNWDHYTFTSLPADANSGLIAAAGNSQLAIANVVNLTTNNLTGSMTADVGCTIPAGEVQDCNPNIH